MALPRPASPCLPGMKAQLGFYKRGSLPQSLDLPSSLPPLRSRSRSRVPLFSALAVAPVLMLVASHLRHQRRPLWPSLALLSPAVATLLHARHHCRLLWPSSPSPSRDAATLTCHTCYVIQLVISRTVLILGRNLLIWTSNVSEPAFTSSFLLISYLPSTDRSMISSSFGVFSATMPPEAHEITQKFMNKPVRILVKRDEPTLEGIKQFYVTCMGPWQLLIVSGTRRLDDDSYQRLDDYRAELHNLWKEDVYYYQTSK